MSEKATCLKRVASRLGQWTLRQGESFHEQLLMAQELSA